MLLFGKLRAAPRRLSTLSQMPDDRPLSHEVWAETLSTPVVTFLLMPTFRYPLPGPVGPPETTYCVPVSSCTYQKECVASNFCAVGSSTGLVLSWAKHSGGGGDTGPGSGAGVGP